MPDPQQWPILLPEEPFTQEQAGCYINAGDVFVSGAEECEKAGGTPQEIQACIQGKYNTYLAYLPYCDTL